jgi:hypothetical protein
MEAAQILSRARESSAFLFVDYFLTLLKEA